MDQCVPSQSTSCMRFARLTMRRSPLTVGHMPFGKVDAMRDQSNYANQIFDRYHETIAAHFYGHRCARLFPMLHGSLASSLS